MTESAAATPRTERPGPVSDLGPVVMRPIASVRPAPDNPRKISPRAVEQVAKSLREFGWQQPLVVDADGVLIVGHTRLLAARSLKLTEVPVTVAEHLTDAQVRAYRIADNRTSDFTTWDLTALTQQLDELAGEFSDVLALADWQGIVADFDAIPDPGLTLDPDPALAAYAGEQHAVLVVLDSEASARAFAEAAVKMTGVLDVRDRNRAK